MSGMYESVSTLYGKILQTSGISLKNGTYIRPSKAAMQLIRFGDPRHYNTICQTFQYSGLYGRWDNVRDGIGLLKERSFSDRRKYYTFHPWKEIFSEEWNIIGPNPRRFVTSEKNKLEGLHLLPQGLQNEFFELLDGDCDYYQILNEIMYGKLQGTWNQRAVSKVMEIWQRFSKAVERKALPKIKKAISILCNHNICVLKGQIVLEQLQDLYITEIENIPTNWTEAEIQKDAVDQVRDRLTLRRRR